MIFKRTLSLCLGALNVPKLSRKMGIPILMLGEEVDRYNDLNSGVGREEEGAQYNLWFVIKITIDHFGLVPSQPTYPSAELNKHKKKGLLTNFITKPKTTIIRKNIFSINHPSSFLYI